MIDRDRLPLTLNLPMPFTSHVYPSPERGKGAKVRGGGHITFTFEPTEDPNIARVRIEDIWLKLLPCRIPFDIDRDGELECIDIPTLKLDASAFDLEESGGQYNLESKHISLKFVFSLGTEFLNQLVAGVAGLNVDPIRLEILERGWLDLEKRIGSTHSLPFTVPEGPFAGLTFLGGQFEGEIGQEPCTATVNLGVSVIPSSGAIPDIPPPQAPNEIWICPNTFIVLLWQSFNADKVIIEPGVGERKPSGVQVIPGNRPDGSKIPAVDRDLLYEAETKGSCTAATDKVIVNVIEGSEEISQVAESSDFFDYWSTWLPEHTYDQKIIVGELIIDTTDPTGGSPYTDSITHPRWRVDHVASSTGAPINHLDTPWTDIPDHSLPGEYRFTPLDEGGRPIPLEKMTEEEKKRKIYFRLKVNC